jgi:predicted GTPase
LCSWDRGTPACRRANPWWPVTATRTGAGKSPLTQYLAAGLRDAGVSAVTVRHPMPYGDLGAQAVQRFADYEDFERHGCTIEEREEYEPYVRRGLVIYAGVDYRAILDRGRGRGRRHSLGWRQQRLCVFPARI